MNFKNTKMPGTCSFSEKRKKQILEEIIPGLYEQGQEVIDLLVSDKDNIRKAELLSEYAGTKIYSGEAEYITDLYKNQSYTTEKMFLKD